MTEDAEVWYNKDMEVAYERYGIRRFYGTSAVAVL